MIRFGTVVDGHPPTDGREPAGARQRHVNLNAPGLGGAATG